MRVPLYLERSERCWADEKAAAWCERGHNNGGQAPELALTSNVGLWRQQ